MEQIRKLNTEYVARQIELDLRVLAGFAARRAVDAMLAQEGVPYGPLFVETVERLELAHARLKLLRDKHPEWRAVWTLVDRMMVAASSGETAAGAAL